MQPMTIPEIMRASTASRSCRPASAGATGTQAARGLAAGTGVASAGAAGTGTVGVGALLEASTVGAEVGLADRRALLDLARRAVGDDAARVHHGDRVAQREDEAHVVVDQQHAAPGLADLVDQ